MRFYLRFFIMAAVVLAACIPSTVLAIGDPITELSKILKVFDSLRYTSFNIHMELNSDTVNGYTVHEDQNADYTISGKSIYYKVGNTEVLQTDSFQIAAVNDSKVLLLQKSSPKPVRAALGIAQADSILAIYNDYYTISSVAEDSLTNILTFTLRDSLAVPLSLPYTKISYEYSSENYQLQKAEYEYYDYIVQEDTTGSPGEPDTMAAPTGIDGPNPDSLNVMGKYTLSMSFESFRFDLHADDLLTENRFVYYDGRKFWPAGPYRSYEFYDTLTRDVSDREEDDSKLPGVVDTGL